MKRNANNPLKSMKFLDKLICLQLLQEQIRGNYGIDEFTKSLLANQTYVYKYEARYVQIWGSANEKAVAKYAVERVFASFAIKNMQNYSFDIIFIFNPRKMITKKNVPCNFFNPFSPVSHFYTP